MHKIHLPDCLIELFLDTDLSDLGIVRLTEKNFKSSFVSSSIPYLIIDNDHFDLTLHKSSDSLLKYVDEDLEELQFVKVDTIIIKTDLGELSLDYLILRKVDLGNSNLYTVTILHSIPKKKLSIKSLIDTMLVQDFPYSEEEKWYYIQDIEREFTFHLKSIEEYCLYICSKKLSEIKTLSKENPSLTVNIAVKNGEATITILNN